MELAQQSVHFVEQRFGVNACGQYLDPLSEKPLYKP